MSELEALHAIFDGYRHVPRDVRGRREVAESPDLDRILTLPVKPAEVPDMAPALRKPHSTMELLDAQNDALWNASQANGLLGFMLPGSGKSGTALLLPTVMRSRNAVILTRSTLRSQMLSRDVPLWGNNFDVKLDRIRFVSYEELSDAETADELDRSPPDLLILDEAHRISNLGSARGLRLKRFRREHPECRLVALSGSLVADSIDDYAFFADWALGRGSPLPLDWKVLQEWKKALDPPKMGKQWGPGALERLIGWAGGNVPLRVAFRRRLNSTIGVSVCAVIDVEQPLNMHLRELPASVDTTAIRDHLAKLRRTEERPDGEVLKEPLALHRCARQMGFGFYLRANKEDFPEDQWNAYWDARRAWGRAARTELKRNPVEGMDSPMLLAKAAERMICTRSGCGRYHKETKDGTACSACGTWLVPAWPCPEWHRWKAVKDTIKPTNVPVWFTDVVVQDAVRWGREYVGVIWYRSPALGQAIAAAGGFPFFGDGAKASLEIQKEHANPVKRTIVASIFCHGEGRDLQSWDKNLVTDPPGNGKEWEQLLARTHRRGQKHHRVDFWVYRHTLELCAAFDTSLLQASFVEEAHGIEQRLLRAGKSFASGAHADRKLLEAIVRAGDSLTED